MQKAKSVCMILFLCGVCASAQTEITLSVPDNIFSLPDLDSSRVVVHQPTGWEDLTYHHDPLINIWNGNLYIAWNASQRSEKTRPVMGMISRSQDSAATWSPAAQFASSGDNATYEQYMRNRHSVNGSVSLTVNIMPWCFNPTQDKLYLFSKAWVEETDTGKVYWRGRVHSTTDGINWTEIPPATLDTYTTLRIRTHWSNHRFVKLQNGHLMAASLEASYKAPTTADVTGLNGWTGGNIPVSVSVSDPGVWQDADGTIHYVVSRISNMWHAYSEDNGSTWTELVQQDHFPTNLGCSFGKLPNGKTWHLGTPLPYSQRSPMILSISDDGWDFGQSYIIRKEPFGRLYDWAYKGYRPGYEYPDAVCEGNTMYIAYSNCRDLIEVSIVDISSLLD